jgi:enoyl-[acyl-carrier protein] reductase I
MKKNTLQGKIAFVAGVGDDQGYGWAIAKALAQEGARVIIGTWPPILRIFEMSWSQGKFDESRKLSDGSLFEIEKVYALDAAFDKSEDLPKEILENKRYKDLSRYTISEVAEDVRRDFGQIDILVHSLANGPEAGKPLLDTSRKGYLAAINASSYSMVSLVQNFGSFMPKGSSAISLTYIASERAVPGYGGGLSSAKSALESDTRTLSFEAGRKWGIRINTISAGPLRSRAARAIGFIDKMIDYSYNNSPLEKHLEAEEVGEAAVFLLSPQASAITGVTLYVDNGLHAMGIAVDSPAFKD